MTDRNNRNANESDYQLSVIRRPFCYGSLRLTLCSSFIIIRCFANASTTGTRSKIFNEIVLKDNHFIRYIKNVYRMTVKKDMVMQLIFTHLPNSVCHSKYMVALSASWT